MSANSDPKRELLRHTLATLAYRGGKAVRNAPAGFAEFRAGESGRTPGQILAHLGDLLDWALSIAQGKQTLARLQALALGPGSRADSSPRSRTSTTTWLRRNRCTRRREAFPGPDRRCADPRRANRHAAPDGGCADQGRELFRGRHRLRPRGSRASSAQARVPLKPV